MLYQYATLVALVLMPNSGIDASAHKFISSDDLVHQIIFNQTSIVTSKPIVAVQSTTSKIIEQQRNNHGVRVNLVNSFPPDIMSYESRLGGGFVVHLAIYIYLCLLLAVIIDSYFLPSLQYFSTVFDISPNISGSTLMAFGTSSPEFFTTLISVAVSDSSSIATGAIIGSSIVNTLAIPGICGLAILFMEKRPTMSKYSRFPMVRDLLFYAITVIIFILSIKDNVVDSLESLIFIFIYLLYIFTLYLWSNIRLSSRPRLPQILNVRKRHCISLERQVLRRRSSATPSETMSFPAQPVGHMFEDNRCISYPLLPFLSLVRLTIPWPNKNFFILTFIMCCLWISTLTYFNLWMVSLIGDSFDLPESVSGMTILAFGTNLPELISSYIIVRKYHQVDVAICHTIGSNIFDILICLGLPWFLQIFTLTIKNGSELSELGNHIIPMEHSLLYFVCLSLILPIMILSFVLYHDHWSLTPRMGFICIAFYCAFIVIVFILRINSLI
ncbi:hypothetical protein RDWZM_000057 [Blomia tropicalis]|uniref:Sodium/calcium exchanger membrane region domain-containing protein n=1 Tax=Blomia tropicalis TaxID=40697 RepID=A0A9Q0M9E8_BLOTA|nr:hypothetical protein RDWZM_000057 [Blomia tropicalis]